MFGFSMFLNKGFSENDLHYIHEMRDAGFEEVFTSLHIPEYDTSLSKNCLYALGRACKEQGLKLTVDISPSAFKEMGLSLENTEGILQMGITGIRFDYGFTMKELAYVSRNMFVALNASTIVEEDIKLLKKYGANFDNIEAWHNYYPRDETGLSKQFLTDKNRKLKKMGFTTMAFVPGDEQLRGPIFSGLPTLEKHRGHHSLSSAVELLNDTSTDKVFVGDPRISKLTMEQFKAFSKEKSVLLFGSFLEHAPSNINKHFHNRLDTARDVIRLEESRSLVSDSISPQNTDVRETGSITIDNLNYGRYMGEIQITRRDLPSDKRVNVIGKIRKEDIDLLPLVKEGQRLVIREVH